MKCIYGIKRPRPESSSSITAYAEKKGYPTQNIAVFSDSSNYLEMIRNPIFRDEIFGTMIFDSDLNLLRKDTTLCQWSGCPRLAVMHPDSVYRTVPEFDSRRLFSGLTLINDTLRPGTIANGSYDFIVVNKWAKFIGKMNDRIFPVDSCAAARKDLRIRCIDLNLDIREEWKMTRRQIRNL